MSVALEIARVAGQPRRVQSAEIGLETDDSTKMPAAAGVSKRAQWGTRTPDPLLTMEVLYQLS
ncbi:MAG: hypothetical protein JWO17_1019 [Actinomycetia bacterium]|nr:hypothetical protein [Actinomycetes bacterium]